MKKNFFIFPVLFCLMCVLTACPEPDPIVPEDGDPTDVLTPDEQKDFLVEVGEQLIGTFNPNDQKQAVDLAEDLYNKYESYDWDAIGEEFMEVYDDIYSSEFESFFSMPKRIINAINGKQKASLEDIEIFLTLSKFGYTIEFNDNTKSANITKTGDNAVVANFSDSDGTKCELKVWGEGKEIEASYTYEDYHWEVPQIWNEYLECWEEDWENAQRVEDGKRTIRVEIPTSINMHLKHGSNSLISLTFNWDSNIKDYVNTSLDMKVINLGFKEESKVSTTEATAVFSFTYSDKNIITAAVNLPKYKLISWEGGNDITEEEGANWIEEYDEKYASLLGKLGKGEAKIDILGKIQLKGGFTDGAALIDAYYNWEDKYDDYNWSDYERTYTYTCNYTYWDSWLEEYRTDSWEAEGYYNAWWEEPYYTLEAKQAQRDFLNKYTYLSVYYNNGTTEQAKLLMDTYEEHGTFDPVSWEREANEWYSGGEYEYYYTNLPNPISYNCYNIEPVMYFPYEKTSIAVLTYFNSSKFLGLIDLVEDLANRYIALDKNNVLGIDEVDFDF